VTDLLCKSEITMLRSMLQPNGQNEAIHAIHAVTWRNSSPTLVTIVILFGNTSQSCMFVNLAEPLDGANQNRPDTSMGTDTQDNSSLNQSSWQLPFSYNAWVTMLMLTQLKVSRMK